MAVQTDHGNAGGGDVLTLLRGWRQTADMRERLNFSVIHYLDRQNTFLGLAVIVLTVLLGAVGLKSNGQADSTWNASVPGWVAALAGFAAALLSGLQTFLKPGDLAQKHRTAAVRYGALKREIDETLVLPPKADDVHKVVDQLRKKLDDIELIEPPISNRLYQAWAKKQPKQAARP